MREGAGLFGNPLRVGREPPCLLKNEILLEKQNINKVTVCLLVSLDGFNVVAAYNLCDAATFLKTILGSYWWHQTQTHHPITQAPQPT